MLQNTASCTQDSAKCIQAGCSANHLLHKDLHTLECVKHVVYNHEIHHLLQRAWLKHGEHGR